MLLLLRTGAPHSVKYIRYTTGCTMTEQQQNLTIQHTSIYYK